MGEVLPPMHGEELTDAALGWLARAAGDERPFYLQVGYHEPHRARAEVRDEPGYMGFLGDYLTPDNARGVTIPRYLRETASAREELAELQGAVRALDAAVGRLLAGLRGLGLEDRTVVIFTTDHGVALPRAKCSLYDPGLEVALIVRHPARGWHGGRTVEPLISNLDLFPTLLEMLGLPIEERVQGRSQLAALDGTPHTPPDEIFGEMTYHDYYDPRRCIRTERYKLIVNFSAAPSFMDPSQSWQPRTVTAIPADPALAYHAPIELYDLAADPNEWRNLADEPDYATIRGDLLACLGRWMRETGDPLLAGAVTSPMHRRVAGMLAGEG
jgi:arylsulfatase A-like enzyme